VIVSGLAGIATLVLVHLRRYEPARYNAALAIAGITAGWALARWPTILPGLTVDQAAAGHDTLVCVVVAVLAGGVIVFPALALLFRLTLAGRFRTEPSAVPEAEAASDHPPHRRPLARLGGACLISGFGLLNIADATWAHGIGVVCLLGFVVLAFAAIVIPAPAEDAQAG
jgi:cytochrome bd ubiquinol oxidase subunit II